jgi:hypothetical protein
MMKVGIRSATSTKNSMMNVAGNFKWRLHGPSGTSAQRTVSVATVPGIAEILRERARPAIHAWSISLGSER